MRYITDLNCLPTAGAILGARGFSALNDNIQYTLGANNYFGSSLDRYKEQQNSFISTFIEPIRAANKIVEDVYAKLSKANVYQDIQTEEDLRSVPPIMVPSVLTDPNMFDLLKQGRICGWGYEASELEYEYEVYNRLIDNGTVISDNVEAKDEHIEFKYEWRSDDPVLTLEDIEYIEQARTFVNKILNETNLDPTDLDELRG